MYYMLAIELGNGNDSQELTRHFRETKIRLSNGFEEKPRVSGHTDEERNWWLDIWFPEISIGAPTTTERSKDLWDNYLPQLTNELYEMLKQKPFFRYAKAGVEIEEFSTYSNLKKEIDQGEHDGLILHESCWVELGKPPDFKEFGHRLLWKPFDMQKEWSKKIWNSQQS